MILVLAVVGLTALVVFGFGGYAVVRFLHSNRNAIQQVDPSSMRFNPWPGRTLPERRPGADMYGTDSRED